MSSFSLAFRKEKEMERQSNKHWFQSHGQWLYVYDNGKVNLNTTRSGHSNLMYYIMEILDNDCTENRESLKKVIKGVSSKEFSIEIRKIRKPALL
jgi:hypothetical protein